MISRSAFKQFCVDASSAAERLDSDDHAEAYVSMLRVACDAIGSEFPTRVHSEPSKAMQDFIIGRIGSSQPVYVSDIYRDDLPGRWIAKPKDLYAWLTT